ncbi:MAG: biotin synthase BioB, partial [Muribaculaceae bacterium]|nr:biotin synthase BioB [Muribaculaceae bacterium]
SMGLLDRDELQKLWDAGVRRYHCNLEAAPDFFAGLCTTHTIEDKIRTIDAAREIGFEVCSGGIIGMGETPRQRVGLALALRRVEPHSIPINILCPIEGTPLEGSAPLSDEEVLDAIALFRFVHPRTTLRFAGGRASLGRETQLRAMRIGMNGGVVGDLLTTIGSTVADDKTLVSDAGMQF